MSASFCVICGRSGDEVKVRNGVCLDCFISKYLEVEVKRPVKLVLCPVCGDHKYRGVWRRDVSQEKLAADVEAMALSALKSRSNVDLVGFELVTEVDELFRKPRYLVGKVEIYLRDYEELVSRRVKVPIEVRMELCDRCLREKSGNYEAVLQVRTSSGKMTPEERREVYRIIAKSVNEAYSGGRDYRVIDSKDFSYGIDIYFSSYSQASRAAKEIKKSMGGDILKTEKLVKISKSGKRVSRKTIRIRLD